LSAHLTFCDDVNASALLVSDGGADSVVEGLVNVGFTEFSASDCL
jgi:hypothetical protein